MSNGTIPHHHPSTTCRCFRKPRFTKAAKASIKQWKAIKSDIIRQLQQQQKPYLELSGQFPEQFQTELQKSGWKIQKP